MAKIPRYAWVVIWAGIGYALSSTGALAYFHESWHVKASEEQGVPAEITGPKETTAQVFTVQNMFAGYLYELVFASFYACVAAFIGRYVKSGWLTGAGTLTYAWDTFYKGFISFDLNDAAKNWVNANYPGMWETFHQWTMQQWAIRGGIVLAVACAIVAVCYWHPAKQKPGRDRAPHWSLRS